MQQQKYFLQQMGITVWQSNTKPENDSSSPTVMPSSLWIVPNKALSDDLQWTEAQYALLGNIVKAMQLADSNWLELSCSDILERCASAAENELVFPQWLWLMGLSEQEEGHLKEQIYPLAPQLQIISSCDLAVLANSKAEKAILWQQISKFLK